MIFKNELQLVAGVENCPVIKCNECKKIVFSFEVIKKFYNCLLIDLFEILGNIVIDTVIRICRDLLYNIN